MLSLLKAGTTEAKIRHGRPIVWSVEEHGNVSCTSNGDQTEHIH